MCCEGDEKKKTCRKPENLKGTPEECTPEQIRTCHGDGKDHPCRPKDPCRNPEALKGKPGECSPEQVRECHGDAKSHPCAPRKPKD